MRHSFQLGRRVHEHGGPVFWWTPRGQARNVPSERWWSMARVMNLYHVCDDDGEMWVVAESVTDAIVRWKAFLRHQNLDDPIAEPFDPNTVGFVTSGSELLLPAAVAPVDWSTVALEIAGGAWTLRCFENIAMDENEAKRYASFIEQQIRAALPDEVVA